MLTSRQSVVLIRWWARADVYRERTGFVGPNPATTPATPLAGETTASATARASGTAEGDQQAEGS